MILRQQYLKRLSEDLDRWAQKGLIDPTKIPTILKDAQGEANPNRLTAILAVLGVVLLGFAAMSFVAANWAEMSKLSRLVILLTAMWASIGIAIWRARTEEGGPTLYTDAAVLLAVIVFGVAIMFIGQMYHVGGEYSGGLMLWMIGALLTAWLAPSRAALALALILIPMWSAAVLTEDPTFLHWEFVIPISVASLLVVGTGWRAAAHLLILAWGAWALMTGLWLVEELDWPATGAFSVAVLLAIIVFAKAHIPMDVIAPFEDAMIHWGLLAIMGGSFFMLLVGEKYAPFPEQAWVVAIMILGVLGTAGMAFAQKGLTLADFATLVAATLFVAIYPYLRGNTESADWLLVVAYFAASVWAVSYGTRTHDRFSINLGFAAFGIMALYVYFRTVGTLLGNATFFAGGGLLLIGLSIGLARIRREVMDRETDGSADASNGEAA